MTRAKEKNEKKPGANVPPGVEHSLNLKPTKRPRVDLFRLGWQIFFQDARGSGTEEMISQYLSACAFLIPGKNLDMSLIDIVLIRYHTTDLGGWGGQARMYVRTY